MNSLLCFAKGDVTLNLDNTEQDTYKTREGKTELPTKGGKIQKEPRGRASEMPGRSGPPTLELTSWGLQAAGFEDSVLHLGTWGWGGHQNLTGKHLQTIFNTDFTLSLFFGKMDDREKIKKV